MANLFCFGLGYTAEHFLAAFAEKFDRMAGTVRSRDRARDSRGRQALAVTAFDGATDGAPELPAIAERLAETDCLLVSVPPDERGDPVLRHCADAIARAPRVSTIVYLSTVGVYGDHGGAWVDESTVTNPVSARSVERLAAEEEWRALAGGTGKALAIFRLPGIYGPGRNALLQVAGGTASRIVKPGQVFNRVHVGDIAAAIAAAFACRADGIFNVTDDEPTEPGAPIAFAAELLGVTPPPEVAFSDAAESMSEMALSFWRESKRVRNDKMKRELGMRLAYPTYREGLRALFAAGEGRGAPG